MQTLSLNIVGIATLAAIVHSSGTGVGELPAKPRIAVIDCATIIDELDGICVCSISDNAIDLSSATKAQIAAVLKTIGEIDAVVADLCSTHQISLVLRRSRREGFRHGRDFMSPTELKNKLSRQLN